MSTPTLKDFEVLAAALEAPAHRPSRGRRAARWSWARRRWAAVLLVLPVYVPLVEWWWSR